MADRKIVYPRSYSGNYLKLDSRISDPPGHVRLTFITVRQRARIKCPRMENEAGRSRAIPRYSGNARGIGRTDKHDYLSDSSDSWDNSR